MKSNLKIQNILMKGIAIVIVLAFIFSAIATLQVVYADEIPDYDAYTVSSKNIDLEELKEIIISMKDENYYRNFVSKVEGNNEILLSNEADLRCLSLYVAQGNSCKGKNFKLKNNIHLTDTIEWNPIGDQENPFRGSIDGAGFTISGMLITVKQSYAGFIGYIDGTNSEDSEENYEICSTIKNLRISNSKIDISPEIDNRVQNDLVSIEDVGYSCLGGIVGYANKTNINNCINETNVSGGAVVGGIAGLLSNSITEYCKNSGYIKGIRTVGGIAGSVRATNNRVINSTISIKNSRNYGTVYAYVKHAGGIAGTVWNYATINGCANFGDILVSKTKIDLYVYGEKIEVTPWNVGGIAGYTSIDMNLNVNGNSNSLVTIGGCYNFGKIEGYANKGLIVGKLGALSKADCTGTMNCIENISEFQDGVNCVGKIEIHGLENSNSSDNSLDTNYMLLDYTVTKDPELLYKKNIDIEIINKYDFNEDGKITFDDYKLLKGHEVNDEDYLQLLDYLEHSNQSEKRQRIIEKLTSCDMNSSEFYRYLVENIYNDAIKVDNKGNSKKFAAKGDKLTITVFFDDKINVSSSTQMMPKLSIGEGAIYNDAEYIGINADGNGLIFEYTVTGNETEESDFKFNSYVYNLPGDKTYLGKLTDFKLWDYIKVAKDSDTSTSVTKNFVSYTISGFKTGDGRYYFNSKDNKIITVDVEFSAELTNAINETDIPKLHINIGGENKVLTADNYSNSKAKYTISTDNCSEGKITDVYLTTDNTVRITDSSNTINGKLGDGRDNTVDTKAEFDNIYIHKTQPLLEANVSTNSSNPNDRYTIGEDVLIKLTSSEVFSSDSIPGLNVYFGDNIGKYNSGNAKYIGYDTDDNGIVTYKYRYTIQDGDEGTMSLKYANNVTISDVAGNTTTYNTGDSTGPNLDIIADTTAPTVIITALDPRWDFNEDGQVNNEDIECLQKYFVNALSDETIKGNVEKNGDINGDNSISVKDANKLQKLLVGMQKISPTNLDSIIYTFTWSEQVKDFDINDITINGGSTEGTLSDAYDNNDGTYSCSVSVIPDTAKGNVGELQVIVEQDAVQDLVGHGNIRTESVIQIDRQAPTLQSIEAHATQGREYYKAGDTIQIVATFNENIEGTETVPTLSLKFSESGDAKGTVSTGAISGNKITYTYTIKDKDNGTLSIKEFKGTVEDVAGNETTVTKRALEGDTVISDTVNPKLVSLTAIAPEFTFGLKAGDTKRYGKDKNIEIIAEYSENIENTETIPTLSLKFSESGVAKGTAPSGEISGKTITYNYTIADGDNGALSIEALTGTVSDLAGNTCTTDTTLPDVVKYEGSVSEENNVDDITADTKSPETTITATAENKDDNGNIITGNDSYYKNNSIIKIKVESNEYLYNYGNYPELELQFSESGNAKGEITRISVNDKSTEFIYKYIITSGDNGSLKITSKYNLTCDIALNYIAEQTTNFNTETNKIIADTTNPYIATNTNSNSQFEINSTSTNLTATGIFSEKMYVLKDGVLSELNNADDAPKMGVFADGEFKGIASVNIATTNDGRTILAYTYNISNIDSPNISCHLISGTLYDRAGNQWSLDISNDTTSPIFEEIQVITESGHYNKDKELDFIVKFNEQTKLTSVPALKIKIGEKEISLTGTINENDELNTSTIKVARYKYKIVDENGPVTIVSLNGTASDGNRTREINEEFVGSSDKIKDHDGDQYINTEGAKVIVDTTSPKCIITPFKSENSITYINPNWDFDENGIVDNNDANYIEEYVAESLEDEKIIRNIEKYGDIDGNVGIDIRDATRIKQALANTIQKATNLNKIYYAISWSEPVYGFSEDNIDVINGIKGTFTGENGERLYIVEVDSVNEGRQIVKIPANVCHDEAGNINTERVICSNITIDYTKPEVRAKVNGGKFVIDTDSNKSTLKETLVVNEEISAFRYVWSTEQSIPEEGWITYNNIDDITVNNDITVSTDVQEEGTYYLYIKLKDKAENVFTGRTNAFEVVNSRIEFTGIPENVTNNDVTVNVNYGEGLTQNRRAGVQGKTQSADPTTVIVTETGKVYAEATDIAGNKVYAVSNEIKIASQEEPIDPEEDTTPPVITFDYTVTRTTLGNPIGATITTNEDAKISYSWDNENWTTSSDYVRSINVTNRPTTADKYTLYAKAVDKAQPGNESEVKTLEFRVVENSEQPEDPSGISITVDTNGTGISTTTVDGQKYLIVSPTISADNLMNNITVRNADGTNGDRTKLAIDNKVEGTNILKTKSEVKYNGDTKYIVVVKGDVDCNGKVQFNDILQANKVRMNQSESRLDKEVLLAADFGSLDGVIRLKDISDINKVRMNSVNS